MSPGTRAARLSQEWRSKGLIPKGAIPAEALRELEYMMAGAFVECEAEGLKSATQVVECYKSGGTKEFRDVAGRIVQDLKEMRRGLEDDNDAY